MVARGGSAADAAAADRRRAELEAAEAAAVAEAAVAEAAVTAAVRVQSSVRGRQARQRQAQLRAERTDAAAMPESAPKVEAVALLPSSAAWGTVVAFHPLVPQGAGDVNPPRADILTKLWKIRENPKIEKSQFRPYFKGNR